MTTVAIIALVAAGVSLLAAALAYFLRSKDPQVAADLQEVSTVTGEAATVLEAVPAVVTADVKKAKV